VRSDRPKTAPPTRQPETAALSSTSSAPPPDKDGDQSTSGSVVEPADSDVVGADEAGLAEFRGASEDDLGRDARAHGAATS